MYLFPSSPLSMAQTLSRSPAHEHLELFQPRQEKLLGFSLGLYQGQKWWAKHAITYFTVDEKGQNGLHTLLHDIPSKIGGFFDSKERSKLIFKHLITCLTNLKNACEQTRLSFDLLLNHKNKKGEIPLIYFERKYQQTPFLVSKHLEVQPLVDKVRALLTPSVLAPLKEPCEDDNMSVISEHKSDSSGGSLEIVMMEHMPSKRHYTQEGSHGNPSEPLILGTIVVDSGYRPFGIAELF